jgi:ribosomal-protein-serine acetyltransferase
MRVSIYFPKIAKAAINLSSTVAYIEERVKQADAKESYCFLIEDTKNKKLAGIISLKSFDWTIPKCEMGYFVDKDYEGKGIITKGLTQVIRFCFDTLKLKKLFLRIAPNNFPSKRVAEKNGFIVEGTLRNEYRTGNGDLIDVNYYGLVNE